MFTPPPLPGWNGLHPLVIHFPVALLLVAPLFIVLGIVFQKSVRCFLLAALVIMVLGTAATFVAVPTGEAAARLAVRTDEMAPVLTRHQDFAEKTRLAFTVLTVLFAAGVVVAKFFRLGRLVSALLLLAFLALYTGAALLLANTAHNGGRLVHQFGVHAMVAK
jgi:uncharacterized membrane protein